MAHNFGSLVFTPLVKALQEKYGSRRQYARLEAGHPSRDLLGADESAFIAERDSFYVATATIAPTVKVSALYGQICRYTHRGKERPMADIDLAQAEADALIAMEKHRVDDNEWLFPCLGKDLQSP